MLCASVAASFAGPTTVQAFIGRALCFCALSCMVPHVLEKSCACMQLGVLICQFMALLSYIKFVYVACIERTAVKRENSGRLPHLIPPDASQSLPVATVARRPSESVASPAPQNTPSMPDAATKQLVNGIMNENNNLVVVAMPAPQNSVVAAGVPAAEAFM
jgi:hypothetical protein